MASFEQTQREFEQQRRDWDEKNNINHVGIAIARVTKLKIQISKLF